MKHLTALVRGLKKSLLTATLASFTLTMAQAAIVQPPPATLHSTTLAWNPPSGVVQNYRLLVGTESRQYTQFYDSGTTPMISVGELEQGKTYYFSVRAIGADGLESELSAELVVEVAPATLPIGTSMTAPSLESKAVQWSYPVAGLSSSPEFIVQASTDMVNWSDVGAVSASAASNLDGEMASFTFPISTTVSRMFYRLTARNFVGGATVP